MKTILIKSPYYPGPKHASGKENILKHYPGIKIKDEYSPSLMIQDYQIEIIYREGLSINKNETKF